MEKKGIGILNITTEHVVVPGKDRTRGEPGGWILRSALPTQLKNSAPDMAEEPR